MLVSIIPFPAHFLFYCSNLSPIFIFILFLFSFYFLTLLFLLLFFFLTLHLYFMSLLCIYIFIFYAHIFYVCLTIYRCNGNALAVDYNYGTLRWAFVRKSTTPNLYTLLSENANAFSFAHTYRHRHRIASLLKIDSQIQPSATFSHQKYKLLFRNN